MIFPFGLQLCLVLPAQILKDNPAINHPKPHFGCKPPRIQRVLNRHPCGSAQRQPLRLPQFGLATERQEHTYPFSLWLTRVS